ncbi:MAG: hypothetical protein S4CHLAM2_04100 [Chlamydiales bacterium]|nr:hypothetical protein [Chlamydiales bacterium]
MGETQLILSLTDWYQALKRVRWLIVSAALVVGAVFFGYSLLKPPRFTAEGVFKGGSQPAGSSFTKALEFLGGDESYSTSDDPVAFLHCYPVMEDVVRTLNLQMHITAAKSRGHLRQIWHTLKAERAGRLLKSKRPSSSILRVPVASKPIIPDAEEALCCLDLHYPGDVSARLKLTFIDPVHFEVWEKKKRLGVGELGLPFAYHGGFFTLAETMPVEGKTFFLTCIPLEAAAKSLQKTLQVKRSKESKSLVHVTFTHSDRHLAAAIVNCAMDRFQHYLKNEGRQKITHQLGYLQQRQQETLDNLEEIMDTHKHYLASHLDAGEMLMLENELSFMAQKQGERRRQLDSIANEMVALSGDPSILEKVRREPNKTTQTLTLETARALIREHELSLDHMRMEQEQYDYCLAKLDESDFDASSLSKVIDDATLKNRFNAIHAIHRNLVDQKNWTEKERTQLHAELATEKNFLIKHLHDLKEGAFLKQTVLSKRLHELQESLLFLLHDQFERGEKNLHALSKNAAHFPEKWLTEQKIALNTKMNRDMIESITKMIEAKNIGYHLDYLSALPLMKASAPLIPDSPKLFLKWIIGSLLGGCLVSAFVFLREVWLGPTASYENLKSGGKKVLSYHHRLEDLKQIHYHLQKGGSLLSVITPHSTFAHDLCLLFAKAGQRVLLIDLTRFTTHETATDTEFGEQLTLKLEADFKEVFLGSERFEEMLKEKKNSYDRIVLFSKGALNSLEAQLLIQAADQATIQVCGERWSALPPLPESALIVVESPPRAPLKLAQIVPFLEKVISFPPHTTQEPQQTENHVP